MGKCLALIIFIASSLLLVLKNLELVHALGCAGNSFSGNSTYNQNRHNLFSTLASNVSANHGFYNASLGQKPNRVRALVYCAGGYEEACIRCVKKVTQVIQMTCPYRMDSFQWDIDDAYDHVSCLVRSSNNATFRNLELRPADIYPNPESFDLLTSKDLNLFSKQWEATVNRTVQVATEAKTSLPRQYFGAVKAEFTEFPTVYMLMQCTPDITSGECKICLETSVISFKNLYWGRKGGQVSRPSCMFRWEVYTFHGAFDNVTIFPAPPRAQPPTKGSSIKDKKGRSIYREIIVIIVVLTFITLLVCIGFFKVKSRKKKIKDGINEFFDSDGQVLLRFDLDVILMATNDFSSEKKLGQGGFGTVYKGILQNGSEMAVKRLTKGSEEGGMEFKNEVSLLTRLQHKNLVKLLGFCNEGDEEILVYEFVPNSSLDHFIFDEEKRSLLTWEVRFKIIKGVALCLVYLHEDSQLKIIHRDLKAGNILLDAEMNPKVADFGTARLFKTDETRAETIRIAGTRGYMAPEYLTRGEISAKSDVYSFGVVLLEMISGERNNSFEGEGIAAFAWKRWAEGRPEVIIDPLLIENPNEEIIKLIQIGLLCVQENATKRPTMRSVVVWLGNETTTIALPKAPASTSSQSQSEDGTMSMSNVFTELSCR